MSRELDWNLPHASQRSPLFARNVVATSQPLAAQAGIAILQRGGNAIDAAVATAIALTVVEPNNNGVGSDAFAIVWDGEALYGINGSGRVPARWSAERFAGLESMPFFGWDAVTVPGAVSVWRMLSERFGRLDFGELFRDAIHYARAGFPVGPISAREWAYWGQKLAHYPEFQSHFVPEGRTPGPGEIFRRPELANTLEVIAESRGEAFYRGVLAEAIAAHAAAQGAALGLDDLAAHEANWVDPLGVDYQDITLHEIPPNAQGMAAQIALSILSHFDLSTPALDSAESVHLQLEAMKIAIRAAFDHFADPAAMTTPIGDLLGADSLARAASSIRLEAAAAEPVALPIGPDTVYLTAADEEGRMVSFIQSNYLGFGSGIVIPGTGIAMQNRGAGFSLEPGHPNRVAGGKRPFHTLIPGFVTQSNFPRLSFGVMGGHMQHQGHLQMVHRIFDHGQNPQAASDAPRWHVFPDFSVGLEKGFPLATAEALKRRGHRIRFVDETAVFGGAQLIYRLDDGTYCAGSDHRKEGQAAGF